MEHSYDILLHFIAICVAGFSAGQNNEILQLAIPEKLLPASNQVWPLICIIILCATESPSAVQSISFLLAELIIITANII